MNFVSLFSGCGGFDLGFIQAGFKCLAAFDKDQIAIDVHRHNLDSPAILHDLTSGCYAYGPYENVDVVIAGPPCQGFSTVGKRYLDDPRNHLLIAAGKRAIDIKPKVFIAENVRGVISGEHKKYWAELKKLLIEAGYKTNEQLINVSELGVPQIRRRMVLIAWNTGNEIEYTFERKPVEAIKGVLSQLEGIPNHCPTYLSNLQVKKIAQRVQWGQKLCDVRGGNNSIHSWDIPEVFGETSPDERAVLEGILKLRRRHRCRDYGDADPLSKELIKERLGGNVLSLIDPLIAKGYLKEKNDLIDLARAYNGKFRRLDPNKPSLTVDTRFGDPRYFLHPYENRGFTVREAARIQGFPDTFVFSGNDVEQYRLIGNAVPPPLGKSLANFVRDNILLKR